ncbi:MAG: UDP-N-acetylgalactosamine-undecaprenyl-phosphate N-acetylgalactosaminephosphotransferase [Cryomorphaceae bacterium]|nr:MAG: UDP-N-acetylgalactosamine-undecaprenyl-phosphate N-acetylgalactosaminephosphotransferase [Cryomorphaceae bacterium]
MMKRLFDFITSLIGLILFSPIFIILSLLVKIYSEGSIFFIQERIGRNGKIFRMIKFRSMTVVQISNSTISVKGDVRITKIGVFLRKYKLDELPELWNVLKGDMSFVGPRPDVCGYADNLKGLDRKILELRPGITGVASLKYYNEEDILALQDNPLKFNDEVIYPDKVRLNLDYYYNNNLWIDIKIIFATIFKVRY